MGCGCGKSGTKSTWSYNGQTYRTQIEANAAKIRNGGTGQVVENRT